MTVQIIHEPNNTQTAGDVVYPIRLLVAPTGIQIYAEKRFLSLAAAFGERCTVGEDYGRRLLALLVPAMAADGFSPLPRAAEPIIVWRAGEKFAARALPDAVRLDEVCDCRWGLSRSRADMPESARVMVVDGTVCAAAWYTPNGVAVETAPDCRRCGFARAVVAALAADRLGKGGEVIYRCFADNAASMALAASLGFSRAGCEYRPGFRRTLH